MTRISAFVTAVFVFASGVRADTLHVPAEYPTIQAGINAAADGDVVLVADGVYTGPGNKGLFFSNKAITVRSVNGAGSTVIDCEGSGVAFWFVAYETPESVVEGFRIANGAAGGSGGAFFCHHGSSPTIRNCVIVNHVGSSGGAIHCDVTASPTFIDCVISGNTSDYGGAILSVTGPGDTGPKLIRCILAYNSATLDGGAVYASGVSPLLDNCVIVHNTAGRDGGGVFLSSGAAMVRHCTIADNVAGGIGGALAVRGPANATMNHSILWGNAATSGGAELAVLNSTSGGYLGALAVSYCDVAGGQSAVYVQAGATLAWGAGNIDMNPQFLVTPGGSYHLSPRSPCVDAGEPAFVPMPGAVDIDGQARVMGCAVEIGADELPAGLPGSGDLNGDGESTAGDVPPFVALLLGGGGSCVAGDMNRDGTIDGEDVPLFVGLIQS